MRENKFILKALSAKKLNVGIKTKDIRMKSVMTIHSATDDLLKCSERVFENSFRIHQN